MYFKSWKEVFFIRLEPRLKIVCDFIVDVISPDLLPLKLDLVLRT